MIIAVQGSKNFDDYEIFMRSMGVAMSNTNDNTIEIWTAGPHRINSFAATFSNVSENYLKSLKKRISFKRVPPFFVEKNINSVDYFAYLCNPNENASPLTAIAEFANIEVGIFRY